MTTTFQQKTDMNVAIKLIPEVPPEKEEDKSKFITIELKCQAGGRANSPTYKKHIRTFENGTPQEYVAVRLAMEEVWRQNSVQEAADKENTIRMLLLGESFTMYEAYRDQATADGTPLSNQIVEDGLKAVAEDVFPHRALFYQKRWMQNGMKLPRALSTRQAVAALIKINNSLPLFPEASEEDKFNEQELLQIMEWMIPNEFRAKFEEKGYIPTDHDRKRFIEESEIVERQQLLRQKPKRPTNQKSGGKAKGKIREKTQGKFCSHHGAGKGHNSEECWTLHPELKPKKDQGSKLSNNKMRKEINALARSENKSELDIVNHKLEQLKKAKAAFEKKDKNKKESKMIEEDLQSLTDSSSSESEVSIMVTEKQRIPKKTKKVETQKKKVLEKEISLKEAPMEAPKKVTKKPQKKEAPKKVEEPKKDPEKSVRPLQWKTSTLTKLPSKSVRLTSSACSLMISLRRNRIFSARQRPLAMRLISPPRIDNLQWTT